MSGHLARRYELLLRAYPGRHRRQWGDEMLGTLMTRTDPSRRWPPVREAMALLASGMRVRLNSDKDRSPRDTWATGLRVAVILLFASQLGDLIIRGVLDGPTGRVGLVVPALGTLAFLAVLRDLRWVALSAALAWQATCMWSYDSVSWPVTAAIMLLAIVVVVPRTHRGPLPGVWWLAVPAATVMAWGPRLLSPEPVYLYPYQQVVTLTVVALCAVAALLDTRAAFAAVGLLLAEALQETVAVTWAGDNPAGDISYAVSVSWWGTVMGAAAAALLVGGHLAARRRAGL